LLSRCIALCFSLIVLAVPAQGFAGTPSTLPSSNPPASVRSAAFKAVVRKCNELSGEGVIDRVSCVTSSRTGFFSRGLNDWSCGSHLSRDAKGWWFRGWFGPEGQNVGNGFIHGKTVVCFRLYLIGGHAAG
jgi:hypothetical protein